MVNNQYKKTTFLFQVADTNYFNNRLQKSRLFKISFSLSLALPVSYDWPGRYVNHYVQKRLSVSVKKCAEHLEVKTFKTKVKTTP